MQIYINEQLLDVQLENEKNFLDVYKEIENSVRKINKIIIDFNISNLDISNQKLEEIPIHQIEKVHFYVGDFHELILYNIQTLDRYIDQMGNFFFSSDEVTNQNIKEFQEGVLWIQDMMDSLSSKLKINIEDLEIYREETQENVYKNLLNLIELSLRLNVQNYNELKFDILKSLRVLKSFTSQFYSHLLSQILKPEEIAEILEKFSGEIDSINKKLIEINTHFQVGEDVQAFSELEKVSEILENYLFYFVSTNVKIKNRGLQEITEKLKELLENLSRGLENQDIVFVGDLLEYELSEFLKEIKEFIPHLKSLLTE